jgi:predicted amidohydrolase YtcJ
MRHAIGLVLLTACAAASAQTRLENVRIHTGDAVQTQAEAMVWDADGRLLAVGERRELARRWPRASVIDGGGAMAIPGLIDAHAHLMNLGWALMSADLSGANSKAEILDRLRAFAADLPPGVWLLGRGWDQNRWPEQAFPTAADLDAAFPDRPVWLKRVDGHAGWANSAALAKATRDPGGDWQPEGGLILRDEAGRPSGVFIDTAMSLIEGAVPARSMAERELAFSRALAESVRLGLTGVHDMGVSLADLGLYRRFADAGRLPLRVTAYADGDKQALAALCAFGPLQHPSGRLQMRGVKLYADGALGSRGAALIDDYSDDSGNRGLLVTPPDALERAMRTARDCGVQVAAHAIGDRGNRIVLDTMQRVLGETVGGDHRWRVEHAQVIALDDIPRFAAMGVLASMQPTHATSDMPWAEARVGPERIRGAYAWQRLAATGARLPLGSDFPVEAVDPRLGLYAAVTRQDERGEPEGGWYPSERMSLADALRGFTREAAFAGFVEGEVGRLAPGLRADFLLLDADPFELPAPDLLKLPLRSTWLDGQAVYRRDGG